MRIKAFEAVTGLSRHTVRYSRCICMRRNVQMDSIDLPALANASDGFSGAEIEQVVVAALYAAHAVHQPLTEFQLRAELKNTRPLSVLMAEQVKALREWAGARTVPAD